MTWTRIVGNHITIPGGATDTMTIYSGFSALLQPLRLKLSGYNKLTLNRWPIGLVESHSGEHRNHPPPDRDRDFPLPLLLSKDDVLNCCAWSQFGSTPQSLLKLKLYNPSEESMFVHVIVFAEDTQRAER